MLVVTAVVCTRGAELCFSTLAYEDFCSDDVQMFPLQACAECYDEARMCELGCDATFKQFTSQLQQVDVTLPGSYVLACGVQVHIFHNKFSR